MQSSLTIRHGKRHLNENKEPLILDHTTNIKKQSVESSIKRIYLKHKKISSLDIVDYIYPIKTLKKEKYEIADHVNLSGYSPLKGPQFIALNNVYHFKNSKSAIVVAGLKDGVIPNKYEIEKMANAGVDAYCYNIVPLSICAASLKIKVKAYGVVNSLAA